MYDDSVATFYRNQIKVITKMTDLKEHKKQIITQVVYECLKFWQGGIEFPRLSVISNACDL